MIRFAIILVPILFGLYVYSVIAVAMTAGEDCRRLPKWAWLLIVLLVPYLGWMLWLSAGRHRRLGVYGPSARPAPGAGPTGATGGEDPFLEQVRARAENQRRAERSARLQRQRQIEEEEARRKRGRENPEPGAN